MQKKDVISSFVNGLQLVILLVLASCATSPDSSKDIVPPDVKNTETSLPDTVGGSEAIIPNDSHFPDPENYHWELVADGLDRPVALVSPADDTNRLFILEQQGRIKIIEDGGIKREPFMDISGQVSSDAGIERGLLGLAFHPDYATNGLFFIFYTDLSGNVVISKFSVSSENPNLADIASEQVILEIQQPGPEHNGGAFLFGPDGYLYIGVGDGEFSSEPQANNPAQDPHSLLGKVLRIDINVDDRPYAIPPGNYFSEDRGRPEVWAVGLRNPWRIAFNYETEEVFIADVGQREWEEINYLPQTPSRPPNFGWDYLEAWQEYRVAPPEDLRLHYPIIEYSHEDIGCAVIGGEVYAGDLMPEWQGVYFFGDFCKGFVWGTLKNPDDSWNTQPLYGTGIKITSFGRDQQGEIFIVNLSGQVKQLVPGSAVP